MYKKINITCKLEQKKYLFTIYNMWSVVYMFRKLGKSNATKSSISYIHHVYAMYP